MERVVVTAELAAAIEPQAGGLHVSRAVQMEPGGFDRNGRPLARSGGQLEAPLEQVRQQRRGHQVPTRLTSRPGEAKDRDVGPLPMSHVAQE